MAFKYLARNRALPEYGDIPIAQLINVPQLQRWTRCQFCHFFVEQRTVDELFECAEKNKCGLESLLWADMRNESYSAIIKEKDFTPTSIVRQRDFDKVPRYLQYYTSDVQGYQCNRLCQYYPSRITDKKTISECAKTNGCGQNGSFFCLLEIEDRRLFNLTDFYNTDFRQRKVLLWDGTTMEITDFDDASFDTLNFLIMTDSDGNDHRVINMIPYTPTAGCLARRLDNTSTEVFCYTSGIRAYNVQPTDVVLLNEDDVVVEFLEQYVAIQHNLGTALPNLQKLNYNTSLYAWFSSNYYFIEELIVDTVKIVVINAVDSGMHFIFHFGSAGDKWLTTPSHDLAPNKWRFTKKAITVPAGYQRINLTSYDGSFTTWLRQIGVRDSLFYSLQ